MADAFSSYYYGNMAAPLRLPNGTLQAAPTYGQPTSVNDLYRGILPSAPAPSPYSPIGPGTGPSGGYAYLQDMMDASQPSNPSRLAPSSPNVDLPGGIGLSPTVLAYGQPGKNYGTGAQMAIEHATAPPRPPKPPLGSLLMAALGMSGGPLFLRGDPGQTDWSKANVSTTDVFGRPLSPTILAALSAPTLPRPAPIPPPMQQQAGAAFLQAQGQNTAGLTAGEVANNLKAAMGSHSRGSFGPI